MDDLTKNLFPDLPEISKIDAGYKDIEEDVESDAIRVEADKSEESVDSELSEHRGKISRSGDVYDPAIHSDPPRETKVTGKWGKKRKKKASEDLIDDDVVVTQNDVDNAKYRQIANDSALIYANLHKIFYGHEAEPKQDEVKMLTDAYFSHYVKHGLPEEHQHQLLIAHIIYSYNITARTTNWEKTCDFFGRWWSKLFGKPKATLHPIHTENK